MLMAHAISQIAEKTPGKESIAMESFAKALRKLPTTIADNAGYDSSELISELRACHSAGCQTYGLSIINLNYLSGFENFIVHKIKTKIKIF